jgi:hypothetical protein
MPLEFARSNVFAYKLGLQLIMKMGVRGTRYQSQHGRRPSQQPDLFLKATGRFSMVFCAGNVLHKDTLYSEKGQLCSPSQVPQFLSKTFQW